MDVITEEEAVAFYDGWMEDVDSSENAVPVVDYESGLLVDALEERVTITERTEPAIIFNQNTPIDVLQYFEDYLNQDLGTNI